MAKVFDACGFFEVDDATTEDTWVAAAASLKSYRVLLVLLFASRRACNKPTLDEDLSLGSWLDICYDI